MPAQADRRTAAVRASDIWIFMPALLSPDAADAKLGPDRRNCDRTQPQQGCLTPFASHHCAHASTRSLAGARLTAGRSFSFRLRFPQTFKESDDEPVRRSA